MSESKAKKILSKVVDFFSLTVPMNYNNDVKIVDIADIGWVEEYYFYVNSDSERLTDRKGGDRYIMSEVFWGQLILNNQIPYNDVKMRRGVFSTMEDFMVNAAPLISDPWIRFIYKENWHVITVDESISYGIVEDPFYIAAFKYGEYPYDSFSVEDNDLIGTYDFFRHVQIGEDVAVIDAQEAEMIRKDPT